jgi:hypothetical protein
VDHGECERKIDFSSVILKPEAFPLWKAGINSSGQPSPRSTFHQSFEHLGLYIDRDYATFGSDATSQFEGEESHAGTWFEHYHAIRDEGTDDCDRVLHPPPQRASQADNRATMGKLDEPWGQSYQGMHSRQRGRRLKLSLAALNFSITQP